MADRVTDMKIVEEYPPNYQTIILHLPAVKDGEAIFCYGDTIYNPYKKTITPDLEVHEYKHKEQQGGMPDLWYEQYLTGPAFRLRQEIEAYGEQYKFISTNLNPPMPNKLKNWALDNMAKALSGTLYGNMIGHNEAKCKIRNYAKGQ